MGEGEGQGCKLQSLDFGLEARNFGLDDRKRNLEGRDFGLQSLKKHSRASKPKSRRNAMVISSVIKATPAPTELSLMTRL